MHLGCHTCWLSYFTLVCLWWGRTVGWAYGHVITKFSRMGRLLQFLPTVLRWAHFARESSAISYFLCSSLLSPFIRTDGENLVLSRSALGWAPASCYGNRESSGLIFFSYHSRVARVASSTTEVIHACVIFNNYSSSPNGLWVNSLWGRRPHGLLTQRPWGREE